MSLNDWAGLEHLINPDYPILLLTVGVSGSGKTSFTKELQKRTDFININNDDLRMSLFGISDWRDYSFSKNEGLIDVVRNNLLLESFNTKRNIILSNINLSEFHIKSYQKLAEKAGYKFGIILFDIPLNICIRRNDNRTQMKLTDQVIADQYKRFCKIFDFITKNTVIPYYVITESFQKELQE